MKKIYTTLMVSALALSAAASTTVQLGPDVLELDTLFHAKVGPGTTQTYVHLSGAKPLNVFYLTVDRTVPGLRFRAVCGEKLAGNMRVAAMADKYSTETCQYFSGVNGDFYWTSGTASSGQSQVGTPTNACIVDGEVFKSSNSSYQFSVDAEGIPRIGFMDFYQGKATSGEKTADFHGINVMSPSNSLTLYTPRFWGSSNQGDYAGSCAEVTAKLVEGERFSAGGKFKVVVTSEPSFTGDIPVPADGFVLFGRGNGGGMGAKAFVSSLTVGDIVEIDNAIVCNGERIYPTQCVSGNPKNVGGGVNLHSEAERADASDRHPRTGIGFSADGNTIVMMVIDGRGVSAGVTTSMLGDMMILAGCAEAVNLDGGGSSTLYTRALGVRNHCSDGSERAVGNGIFACVEGSDLMSNEVAELQFSDWRFDCPPLGIYTPTIYAFNAAGLMIDSDFKDYTLSCPAELGTISADGKTLLASDGGKGLLTVSYGNTSATLPVYIAESEIKSAAERIIVDGHTPYKIQLQALVIDKIVNVSPEAFAWESSDTSVATVAEGGVVTGLADGTATITGKYGKQTVSFEAVVEIPRADEESLYVDENSFKLFKSAISSLSISPKDKGVRLDYTMASAVRSPKITLQYQKDLFSRPDAIRFKMDAFAVKPAAVNLSFRSATDASTTFLTCNDITEDGTDWVVRIADNFDTDNATIYPIFINLISIEPADAAKAEGFIEFSHLTAVYDNGPAGLEEIDLGTPSAVGTGSQWYDLQGRPVDPATATPGLYITPGEKVLVK